MLFGGSQLFLSISQKQSLILGLLLSGLQSRVSAPPCLLLLLQLFPQVVIGLVSYVERLYSGHAPIPFIIQLAIAGIGDLFNPKSSLDSLEEGRLVTLQITIKMLKKKKKEKGVRTMPKYFLRLRKTSCLLIDRCSAISLGSN